MLDSELPVYFFWQPSALDRFTCHIFGCAQRFRHLDIVVLGCIQPLAVQVGIQRLVEVPLKMKQNFNRFVLIA